MSEISPIIVLFLLFAADLSSHIRRALVEKLLNIIQKPNSIIVLLFIQNISRALKKPKLTLLSSVTNCKVDNITITSAANFNSTMQNLKINGISIFVAFCVFLLSLSFNFYLVQHFKPAVSHFLWFCSTKTIVA